MNTLLYSLLGILALVAISVLFSYLGTRKNNKMEKRIKAIRDAARLAPEQLLFTAKNPELNLNTLNKLRGWKNDRNRNPYGSHTTL